MMAKYVKLKYVNYKKGIIMGLIDPAVVRSAADHEALV